MLAGAGDGTYVPAVMLFPFGTVSSLWGGRISGLFIVLAILQYPVYGFIIDQSAIYGKRWTWLLLICIHVALSILILIAGRNGWQ
jgi:hypothetical protein